MRIISGYRDYYDGIGRDFSANEICFVRNDNESHDDAIKKLIAGLLSQNGVPDNSFYRFSQKDSGNITFEVIGFCGKMYPYLRYKRSVSYKEIPNRLYVDSPAVDECFYVDDDYPESLIDFIKGLKGREDSKRYLKSYDFTAAYKNMKKFSSLLNKIDITSFFIDHTLSIFKIVFLGNRNIEIEVNPKLQNSQFYKVFDAFQAYQELDMFLGGVLVREAPEMVRISDKDRLVQHGFNEQSFKHPVRLKDLK